MGLVKRSVTMSLIEICFRNHKSSSNDVLNEVVAGINMLYLSMTLGVLCIDNSGCVVTIDKL